MLGQLAGDSLGSLVEFKDANTIRTLYPNGVRELADGGVWDTLAGQPTDDSEMALALARSLIRNGEFSLNDTLAVALREAREESGLDVRALDDAIFDIDVHGIPARGREPAHLHFDVRFLVQAEHDRFRVSEESHALAWVPAVGLGTLTDEESVLRMARKWVVDRADSDR